MDACMLDVCPMCVCVYVYASKQMHRKEQSSTDQDVWVCNQGRVIGTAQEVKQFVTHLQFKPTRSSARVCWSFFWSRRMLESSNSIRLIRLINVVLYS